MIPAREIELLRASSQHNCHVLFARAAATTTTAATADEAAVARTNIGDTLRETITSQPLTSHSGDTRRQTITSRQLTSHSGETRRQTITSRQLTMPQQQPAARNILLNHRTARRRPVSYMTLCMTCTQMACT